MEIKPEKYQKMRVTQSQVDNKVKNLRGGCSFLSRGEGVSIFLFRGDYPPLNPKIFSPAALVTF